VVVAFIKDDPAKATSLVASIQKLTEANKSKGLKSFVVFMAGPEAKPAIDQLTSEKKITIPVTFLAQGLTTGGLEAWKINPEAKNTILVYRNQKVVKSFVDVEDKGFEEVSKAAGEVLTR
jgi:hypothetical protein